MRQIDIAYFPEAEYLGIFIGPLPGPVLHIWFLHIWSVSRAEWETQGGE